MQPTSKKTAMKMREAYEKEMRKFSTEKLQKKFPERPWVEDAASTWVSRKELNALLDANDADGLRIYYGCHHRKTHIDPRQDYEGLHNLIFVATKDTVDPENPTTETSDDQLIDGDDKDTNSYVGMAGTYDSLCPPNCPPPPPTT